MKLNYDCMRDVLIELEKNLKIDDRLVFSDLEFDNISKMDSLSKYSNQDIYYSIYIMDEIGFIDGEIIFADGGIPHTVSVSNIRYPGHEFLQTIKSDTVWNTVKSKIKPVTDLSIPIIAEVAKSLIISKLGI